MIISMLTSRGRESRAKGGCSYCFLRGLRMMVPRYWWASRIGNCWGILGRLRMKWPRKIWWWRWNLMGWWMWSRIRRRIIHRKDSLRQPIRVQKLEVDWNLLPLLGSLEEDSRCWRKSPQSLPRVNHIFNSCPNLQMLSNLKEWLEMKIWQASKGESQGKWIRNLAMNPVQFQFCNLLKNNSSANILECLKRMGLCKK